jgi:hypothetical protein
MEEAVEKLAVQVALSEMIEKKLMELVTITLEVRKLKSIHGVILDSKCFM